LLNSSNDLNTEDNKKKGGEFYFLKTQSLGFQVHRHLLVNVGKGYSMN
jgi:hypothetical protein